MSASRTGRLLGILQLLRTNSWLSAQELAYRLDVSPRTIYRDVADIQEYGISIRSTVGREGGYQLDDESPFPRALLASGDALGMYVMGGGLEKSVGQPMQGPRKMLDVMKYAGPEAARALNVAAERIYFDTAEWYWRDKGHEWLPVIREAVFNAVCINGTVTPRGGGTAERQVLEPLGLVWKGGEWYLVARQASGSLFRTRLSRFSDVSATGEVFDYPADFDLRVWWDRELDTFGKGDTAVKLRVLPGAQEEFRQLATKSSTQIQAEGDDLVFTFYVDRWEWMVPLVLSHAPHVVVQEPAPVRAKVMDVLRQALSRHERIATDSEKDNLQSQRDLRRRVTHGLGGSRGHE
jgi:predicted DNA-binding transcriptional regulator YafY